MRMNETVFDGIPPNNRRIFLETDNYRTISGRMSNRRSTHYISGDMANDK